MTLTIGYRTHTQRLAPVTHEGDPMIDARALHEWLGSKQHFNDWMNPDWKTSVYRTDYLINGNDLRTIEIDGEPWFVAADACRCLELPIGKGIGSTGRHLGRLGEDERKVVKATGSIALPLFADTRAASFTLITESGLYKLIMRSDKDAARSFQDWVTKVVLPSIRKTGGCPLNENARETANTDERDAMPLPAKIA